MAGPAARKSDWSPYAWMNYTIVIPVASDGFE